MSQPTITALMQKDLELQRIQHALDWYNGHRSQLEKADRVVCANLSAADRLDPTTLAVVRKQLFPDCSFVDYSPPKHLSPRFSAEGMNVFKTAELEWRMRQIEEEIDACKRDPLFLEMNEAMSGAPFGLS